MRTFTTVRITQINFSIIHIMNCVVIISDALNKSLTKYYCGCFRVAYIIYNIIIIYLHF